MERRGFLKSILPAAAGVAVMSKAETTSELNSSTVYRGFKIYWRGWISCVNQATMTGAYYAVNIEKAPDGWRVYSCYPGLTFKYYADQTFDLSMKQGQDYVTTETSQEKLDEYQADAKKRLLKYIDDNYADLTA